MPSVWPYNTMNRGVSNCSCRGHTFEQWSYCLSRCRGGRCAHAPMKVAEFGTASVHLNFVSLNHHAPQSYRTTCNFSFPPHFASLLACSSIFLKVNTMPILIPSLSPVSSRFLNAVSYCCACVCALVSICLLSSVSHRMRLFPICSKCLDRIFRGLLSLVVVEVGAHMLHWQCERSVLHDMKMFYAELPFGLFHSFLECSFGFLYVLLLSNLELLSSVSSFLKRVCSAISACCPCACALISICLLTFVIASHASFLCRNRICPSLFVHGHCDSLAVVEVCARMLHCQWHWKRSVLHDMICFRLLVSSIRCRTEVTACSGCVCA